MKKLFKVFIWFVFTILVLIIVLISVAKLAENKIANIALQKVSESIEAPVAMDEVSFTLLRRFPLATIELNNVKLGSSVIKNSKDSLDYNTDTIVSIDKIYVSVKSRPLIKGIIEIMKVDVEGANINYHVDTSGVTNIDFLMSSTDSTEVDTSSSSPLNLTLTDLTLSNVICNYNDELLGAKARVTIPDLKLDAKLLGDDMKASVKGDILFDKCSYDQTNLYLMNQLSIGLDADYENDSVQIHELLINTDGALLNVLGSVKLGDIIKTDVSVNGSYFILEDLIKYVPAEMQKEFSLNDISGKLNLDAKIAGNYSEVEIPRVDATIQLLEGNVKTKDYPELKNIELKGSVSNGILKNNQSTQAKFDKVHFETAKSKFDIVFSILDIDHPKYNVTTNLDINLAEFRQFIPDSLIEHIDGNIIASLSTKGELPDSIGDDFIDQVMANSKLNVQLNGLNVDMTSSLSIENLSTAFTYKPNNFSVSNLNIDVPAYNFELRNTSLNTDFYGSINNLAALRLNVKDYHIETKGAEISGYVKVKNLEQPSYDTHTKLVFALDETKALLPDSLLSELKGKLMVDIKSKATLNLDSIADQAIDAAFNKSVVKVNMDQITAVLPDNPYTIENLSGNIQMSPEAVKIDKMSGVAAGITFNIDSTEVWNSYETFVMGSKKEIFTLQTNITIDEINNDLLQTFMPTDTTSELISEQVEESDVPDRTDGANPDNKEPADTTIKYLLPDLSQFGLPHFLVRGKLAIKRVEYGKNIVDDISVKFRFADSLYVIDQFKLKTCEGELNTSLKVDARNWENPVIDVKNYISNLNVKTLLMANDNFGDSSLTYEKVTGLLTSELHVRAFYENGEFPTNKVKAQGDFTLEDGSIHGYEPLVELSKNKIVGGLKELDELDFNTLKTAIFMRKGKIFIPKTNIITSSMDITAFAMHGLEGDYEYHLKLNLGDVLTGKNDEIMKEQAKQNKADGSTVERSGIKLYSMEYNGNRKNGFDNDKLEKKFKQELNKQDGLLRLSFKPELVNFSTDLDRTKRNQDIIDEYGKKSE